MQFPIYLTFEQFRKNLVTARRDQPWEVSWNDYQAWTDVFSHSTYEMASQQLPSSAPTEGVAGFARTVMTEAIMRAHFGDGWFTAVYNAEKSSRSIESFFYPNAENEVLEELTFHRKEELARRVHQLQFASWFDLVVAKIASGAALSGAAFELDAALYLMNLPMDVEQKAAPGERPGGQDADPGRSFDLRFWVSDPPKAVEVKTKDDDTPFSQRTIDKTIKKASEQIPAGESGFVFLRLPPSWVGHKLEDSYAEYLGAALTPRAQKSTRSRVSVVFSAVDKLSRSAEGRVVVTRVWEQFRSDTCPAKDWKLAMDLKQLQEAGFIGMAPAAPF